ncbi:SDR family NAD(P)-dependent oxidoreductase [Mesorhizobium sp. YM1C-6-2]|uniref:SDR family NAD(P)-dependent oxidoreductase n=1 Tax=Mesorhizobium sp. YM1C-6-2 TaxID=1827501 RepID=UPI000EF2841F|nr:SDR family NAD(P)-dependent oxidoreductase [Mesorhizobium sp. YM1C-6-2]RLP27737.1 SDR family NAD(P)-dependent oxidoreductase [Mesorhizobium sp. YM1C-6-2]
MAGELAGRVVVVTGGTGALGSAVLDRLLDEGSVCHVPTSHAAAPKGFAFARHGRVTLAPNVDLGDPVSTEAFYATIPDLWASIHCAGGFAMSPVGEAGADVFAAMIDANALTAFLCCHAAARTMRATGTAGRIVNVSARPGLDPRKGAAMSAYAASKAAVAAITVALAEELKGDGILVNAVAPSTLDTPANRKAMPKADFSKWVSLEAAAKAIVQLASPENATISGALAPIYGRA